MEFLVIFGILLTVFYVTTLLHEVGHLVAALVLGFRPGRIRIGQGRDLLHFRIFGTEVRIRPFPWAGDVWVRRFPKKGLRWKGAVFALSGPAVDAAVLIFVLSKIRLEWLLYYTEPVIQGLIVFLMFQWGLLMSNLLPAGDEDGESDGTQFWSYITGNAEKTISAGMAAYQADLSRYDPSFDAVKDSVLLQNPDASELYLSAMEGLYEGRSIDGVQLVLQILETFKLPAAERAMLLDRIACLPLQQGERQYLTQALEWAPQALSLFPASKTLAGTWGSLLVESGRLSDGIAILEPLTSPGNDPGDRGLSACFLGKAYHRRGDRKKADQWFTIARGIEGAAEVCRRIRLELAHEEMKSQESS